MRLSQPGRRARSAELGALEIHREREQVLVLKLACSFRVWVFAEQG